MEIILKAKVKLEKNVGQISLGKQTVRVEIYKDGDGFLLIDVALDGKQTADTWFQDLESAKYQAKCDLGVAESDWEKC